MVNMFNVLGEKVYADVFNGNQKTIRCGYPSGIYFLQIKEDERVYKAKVIIE